MTAFSFITVLIAAIIILVIVGITVSVYLLLKRHQRKQYERILNQRSKGRENADPKI